MFAGDNLEYPPVFCCFLKVESSKKSILTNFSYVFVFSNIFKPNSTSVGKRRN